ncbi:Protein hu-li tai shao [Bienertia sinuspersici]
MPDANGVLSSIVRPNVAATHFELKPQFIQFISQDSYAGLANENPVDHLSRFLEKCDTMKLTNVSSDAIRLRLFPFSLRDDAKEWLNDEGANKYTTWDSLAKAFLLKFFSQKKTSKLRNDISTFRQNEDESLHDAWKRFKRLQRQCPHHGLPDWLLIQTFYNGMTQEFRIYVDAASGGSIMAKTPDTATALLDEMASNDNYPHSDRGSIKKGGKYDIDTLTLLASTVQALTHKVDQLGASSSSSAKVASCETCGVHGHAPKDCQFDTSGMSIEQANALYNSQQRPQNDPYSNTYNPGWRNNPKFSWRDNSNQPPNTNIAQPPNNNFAQPPGFHHRPPFNPPPQPPPQPQKSNLEMMMEQLASQQLKQNDYQSKQNEFFNNSIQQIQAHNKLMENSMTQLAQQLSQLNKAPGHLPGQTESNPSTQKGQINAVTLRSGKELEEPPMKALEPTTGEEKDNSNDVAIDLEKEVEQEVVKGKEKEPITVPIAPYKPPVPFPQRLAQAKLEMKYGKFLEVLKKLHINIPFLDAISEMPSYAKFLKDILSNKRKLEENTTVSLTAQCSAILQNTVPKKLSDPGSYSIPVSLETWKLRKHCVILERVSVLCHCQFATSFEWVN